MKKQIASRRRPFDDIRVRKPGPRLLIFSDFGGGGGVQHSSVHVELSRRQKLEDQNLANLLHGQAQA